MNSYIIKIKVTHPEIEAGVYQDDAMLVCEKWTDDNNLSKTLLDKLDKLLIQSKILPTEIASIETETDQAGFSASRIIQVVEKTANFYLTNSKRNVK